MVGRKTYRQRRRERKEEATSFVILLSQWRHSRWKERKREGGKLQECNCCMNVLVPLYSFVWLVNKKGDAFYSNVVYIAIHPVPAC